MTSSSVRCTYVFVSSLCVALALAACEADGDGAEDSGPAGASGGMAGGGAPPMTGGSSSSGSTTPPGGAQPPGGPGATAVGGAVNSGGSVAQGGAAFTGGAGGTGTPALGGSGTAGDSNGGDSNGGAARAGASAGGGAPDACAGLPVLNHPTFDAIRRLATTTEEVRILVYGQSISEQDWWWKLRDWLRATYPNGNLVMEEHARGGCSSQCLIGHEAWFVDGKTVNRMPEDVFAWRPDLIIFHVYGDHVDYGYIMRGFRDGCAAFDGYRTWDGQSVPTVACTEAQRTAAAGYSTPEVLVQSDHRWSQNYPKTCSPTPDPSDWDCFMNVGVIPGQVADYGYALQDNWHDWARYIEENDVDPLTLTNGPDDVHLSPTGNELQVQMTIPHLCYRP